MEFDARLRIATSMPESRWFREIKFRTSTNMMSLAHSAVLTRGFLVLLCMFVFGNCASCRKSNDGSLSNTGSPGPLNPKQEFQEITKRTRIAPRFLINNRVNEIQLDAYDSTFDGHTVESHKLSSVEWESLRKTLEDGIEVENVKLLALSARIELFDDKGTHIYGFVIYWPRKSGDVYFENDQRWFRVSDRKSVLRAICPRPAN